MSKEPAKKEENKKVDTKSDGSAEEAEGSD